jgi:hypothetical protein
MMNEQRPALYALRRTLPSWCFEERLDELLGFCRTAHVEEVIVKVDVEEFSHGIPTIEWLEAYMPMLTRARDALRKIGVAFSINPWVTTGHLDRGRDLRAVFPHFDWMVGHRGEACRACACPLSKGWREHIRALWRLYASLEPRVIWVEDDIRTFNHTPIEFGCFCDLHLRAFGERIGEAVTRERLVQAVLQPGEPYPWRRAWLALLRDTTEDTCAFLAKAVHEISPGTFLGLMSSGPENHCLEGRDWRRLARALGDGRPIYSRPTLGNYTESSLTGLYDAAAQIKRARAVLPRDTIEQTEVESFPFTGYAKSAAFTFLQIALSVAHGCHGATLNLFDHVGSPLAINPAMQDMLASKRPFLDALAAACSAAGAFRGVRVLHHEGASFVRRLQPRDDYAALAPPDYAWERALNAFGITTTYGDSPVIAADGQMLNAYSDGEIEAMLTGGMLLDLGAAEVLIERGFGQAVGVTVGRTARLHTVEATGAEELTDPEFAGAPERYVTMSLPNLIGHPRYGRVQPHENARVVSRLVDPDREVVRPFTTVFENGLGGRVAVVPLEMSEAFGPAFLGPYRREHLLAILRWLSRDRLPAAVSGGVLPLALRMDFPDSVMLAVFNLSHDDWPEVVWDVHWPSREPERVTLLDEHGAWRDAQAECARTSPGHLRVTIPGPLSFRMPMIVALRTGSGR